MPIYEYRCSNCDHTFEDMLSIADREKPLKKACPGCGKKKVARDFLGVPVMGADAKIKPGRDWKELTAKMKKGIPKRFHGGLDKTESYTGAVYGPR